MTTHLRVPCHLSEPVQRTHTFRCFHRTLVSFLTQRANGRTITVEKATGGDIADTRSATLAITSSGVEQVSGFLDTAQAVLEITTGSIPSTTHGEPPVAAEKSQSRRVPQNGFLRSMIQQDGFEHFRPPATPRHCGVAALTAEPPRNGRYPVFPRSVGDSGDSDSVRDA